jgi:hypothetical protein
MTRGLYDPDWTPERDEADHFFAEEYERPEPPTPDEYVEDETNRERAIRRKSGRHNLLK